MSKMMKGTFVSLAMFAMVCAMVVVGVSFVSDESCAADPTSGSCGDGVTWSYENGVLTISADGTGTGRMTDYSEPYPSLKKETTQPWGVGNIGYSQPSYGATFKFLSTIVIEEGVKYIGDYAFNGHFASNYNYSAKIVIEGSEVPEFGEDVFGTPTCNGKECGLLVEMQNPTVNNVKKISDVVFGAKYDSGKLTLVGGGSAIINRDACSVVKDFFKQNITSIEVSGVSQVCSNNAFNGNYDYESPFIGFDILCFLKSDVGAITSLTVDGEECLKVIGDKDLGYVVNPVDGSLYLYFIPSDVTELVESDFDEDMIVFAPHAGLENLKSLVIPDTVSTIHLKGSYFSSLESLTVKANVDTITTIGVYYSINSSYNAKFKEFSNLKYLDLYETNLTTVDGEYLAFIGNMPSSIEEVVLPSAVTSIPGGIFGQNIGGAVAPNLKTIDLKNVKKVGELAFYQCSSLESVDLTNVEIIYASAFQSCTSLTNVIVGDACNSIGGSAFSSTNLGSFVIPKKLTVTSNVFTGAPIETIRLADGYEGDNVLINGSLYYNDDEKLILAYALYDGSKTFQVPDGVEEIGSSAFAKSKYEFVVFGKDVTTIGELAFNSASVKYLYFENSDKLESIIYYYGLYSPFLNASLTSVYYVGEKDPADEDSSIFGGKTIKMTGADDQFSVEFVTNGGNVIDPITYEIYLRDDVVLPTPVKSGFVFMGWYFDEGLTQPVSSNILVAGTFGDVILYADYAGVDDFVSGVDVIGFSGSTVIINIDSTSKPAGEVIVRYSEYIDVAEGLILFPFKVGFVSVDEGVDLITFSAGSGKDIESCSVTFRYTVGVTPVYTPLSYANAPATVAKMDLTIDNGLEMMFDSSIITNGDKVSFGTYSVEVSGDQTVTVNGVVWTNGDKLFYYGQKLVVTAETE